MSASLRKRLNCCAVRREWVKSDIYLWSQFAERLALCSAADLIQTSPCRTASVNEIVRDILSIS